MVHIYNGILLGHEMECIWVNPNKVNESRAYYTEWSKSEREKQILYTNVSKYMKSREMVLKKLSSGQ